MQQAPTTVDVSTRNTTATVIADSIIVFALMEDEPYVTVDKRITLMKKLEFSVSYT